MPATQRQQAPQSSKETWDEPKTKWGKSKARKLLYIDILEGRVPRKARDEHGKHTAKLREIYESREEFKQYHYSKFSRRLATLRATIDDKLARKEMDKEAFDNYVANHQVSLYSHKGYIQWQGSEAQELALKHIANNVHNTTKWSDWHSEHIEFYRDFPLDAFKDKIRQELRTAKYLHTLEVRGKDARKTKTGGSALAAELTNEPVDE